MTAALSSEELTRMHAYWRAANYLSVGQIYLLDNPLLREPLRREHVKPHARGAGLGMADPVRRALILNAGSSTLKWSLLAGGEAVASGSETWSPADAGDKIGAILGRSSEVHAVGHRVVHGAGARRSG